MKNLIKSIDYNRELENPYINIELENGGFALVQLTKETNRLHAAFGDYSIDIDASASENNYDIVENSDIDLASSILRELRKRFDDEVKDFEEVFSLEIEKYLSSENEEL